MKKRLIDILLFIAIIFFVISIVQKSFTNKDIFFDISTGNAYLNGEIITGENVSWSEKISIVSPKAIFEMIIAIIYNKIGFCGIYIFTIICGSLIGLLYYIILNKITNRKILSFLFTILALYYFRNNIICRVQLLSYLLYLIGFYFIGQLVKTDKNKYMVILFIISIIFLNIYLDGFIVYLLMFIPFIIEKILFYIVPKNSYEELIIENKSIKKLIIVFAITLILGCVLLIYEKNYSNILNAVKDSSSTTVTELREVNNNDELFLYLSTAFIILLLVFTKTKMNLTDAIYIIGFASMVFFRKSVFFYYLISIICICKTIVILLDTYQINIKIEANKINVTVFALIYIVFIINCIANTIDNNQYNYIDDKQYPNSATDYIVNHLDTSNMILFNKYNYGCFVELNGVKPFISSKEEICYRNNTEKLSDYIEIINNQSNYKKIFDEYKINFVLLNKEDSFNNYIREDNDFSLVYDDSYYSLYKKSEK